MKRIDPSTLSTDPAQGMFLFYFYVTIYYNILYFREYKNINMLLVCATVKAYVEDPLVYHGPVTARMGHELLKVWAAPTLHPRAPT